TDPTFNLEELFDRAADSFDLQFGTKPARVVLPKWPPRRLIESSLEYFSSNRLYSIHPVVDIDALTYLLNTSDHDGSGVGTNVADRACLAALTAMITRIRRQEAAFADADPDAYVQAVLSVVPQLMMEHTNVRAIEALIIIFFTSELSPKELLYPSDLRLAMLKSKVYHLLYSEQSLSHSRARRLQLIRELDEELNDLKSQFPAACKPDAVIHGASAIGSTPVSQSLSPPSTSIALCYQAARSTLIYLRRIRHLIFPETFWIYAQILLTSSISLYMRILSAPKQCEARDDVNLLESTIDVFHQLNCVEPSRRFPPFVIIEAFI
ncbi:hypothetical protein CDV55_100206, partial [Aspergillus turcosus]